jgi:hypothetical protein
MNSEKIQEITKRLKEHLECFPYQISVATSDRPFIPGLCRRFGDEASDQFGWVQELRQLVTDLEKYTQS